MRRTVLASVVLFQVVFAGAGFAQGVDADLSGRVTDRSGGRIGGAAIRVSSVETGRVRTATGFVMNAGPKLTVDPSSPPAYPTVWARQFSGKVSYQPGRTVQVTGFIGRDLSIADGNLGSGTPRFVPYESSTTSKGGPSVGRGALRATLGDRALFDTQFGRTRYANDYRDTPGSETVVSRRDLATTQVSGGSISTDLRQAESKRFDDRSMAQGNLTVLPRAAFAGSHEFKTGYRVWIQSVSPGDKPDHPAGNYQLVYNTVNGVRYTPVQLVAFNFPATQVLRENAYSPYLNDRWEMGQRVTLNLGVRWDRSHAWVPAQTRRRGPSVVRERSRRSMPTPGACSPRGSGSRGTWAATAARW